MESTLSLKYDEIAGDVGTFLGWGAGAANGDTTWDAKKEKLIKSFVKSGLRNFYFPQLIQGGESGYNWSFLCPVTTQTLSDGEVTLTLPDDFGGMEGQITVTTTGSSSWTPVDVVGIGQVYQQAAQYPDTTGWPEICCEEPIKGTTKTHGQRFQIRFWPTADQDYTLKFRYHISPNCLDGSFPYAYGGPQHAETILESCLAIAEERMDDQSGGVHQMKFKERLAASIALDSKMKPQTLGLNLDRSEAMYDPRWRHWQNPITIYGGQY